MTHDTALRIMIVEDDPKNAEIQRRFLERLQSIELVGIAHSLADANDLIDVWQPQLVLLDVYLPDGNGLEALRAWRTQHQDMDVILITAAKEVETVRTALHTGVFEYILKPLVFERLEAAIQRYRTHLETLASLSVHEQQDVDSLIGRRANQVEPERLPKGIDPLTLDTVKELMQQKEPMTAEQVGLKIGASRTTARRYLEYLVSIDQLKAEVSYGTVGRPERRYQIL